MPKVTHLLRSKARIRSQNTLQLQSPDAKLRCLPQSKHHLAYMYDLYDTGNDLSGHLP